MTSSSPIKERAATFGLVLVTVCAALLGGCIADTAEDSELPWASNKGWEGIAPIAPSMSDRYE